MHFVPKKILATVFLIFEKKIHVSIGIELK